VTARLEAGGKSELRRAGCWVTPRRGDPTESATETYRPVKGKGEMVRQELTGGRVTGRPGKPHPEQDRIEGHKDARPVPGLVA
jgi:hypothetical protein